MRIRRRYLQYLLFLVLLSSSAPAKAQTNVEIIRVGITEYQNLEETYAKYQDFFQELIEKTKKPVLDKATGEPITYRFRVAIGTYEEVKDWYNTKQIDMALFSAMPASELLISARADPDLQAKIKSAYLGMLTPLPVPENSPFGKCAGGRARRSLFDEIYSEEERQKLGGTTSSYRTISIVPRGSYVDSVAKLSELKGQRKLRFLFVRPYSVSGFLVPAYYLKMQEPRVDITVEDYEFTYQHANTLKRLMEAKDGKDADGKYLVAFVLDSVKYCADDSGETSSPFQQLRIPGWDKQVPSESVLLNYRMEKKRFDRIEAVMTQVFEQWREDGRSYFTLRRAKDFPYDAWAASFGSVNQAIQNVSKPATFPHRFTIDEVIKDLILYRNLNGVSRGTNNEGPPFRPLRLAIVLSGGGAKCAYQVGAINALEQKLEQNGLDVDLVVGTSGGAINALFVAMGVSRTPEGRNCLTDMWRRFSQEDFFQSSGTFNFIFGLSFGILQALIITAATLLFGRNLVSWNTLGKIMVALILIQAGLAVYFNYFSILTLSASAFILKEIIAIYALAAVVRILRRWTEDWWRQAGWLMIGVSLLEIFIKLWGGPSRWPLGLEEDHLFLHTWSMLKLFSSWSAPFPFLLGAIMLITGYRKIPRVDWERRWARLVVALSAGALVAMSIAFLYSLLKEDSPSRALGIESKFIEELPKLAMCTEHDIRPDVSIYPSEQLQDISSKIAGGGLLHRSLVITASKLPIDYRYESTEQDPIGNRSDRLLANELPDDLYFYFRSEQDKRKNVEPPPGEKRFVSLNENKDKLLDVVIGSGTIYPLFPYRSVKDIRVDNKEVEEVRIIDGGFIHNSPIDAAVKWNATHIILIQASPSEKPLAPRNFLDNALVAFNYMFSQAQVIDKGTRGPEIFELRPMSECEKLNKIYKCDDSPQPDMDTFDFSRSILERSYTAGMNDMNSPNALLSRRSHAPIFREPRRLPTEQLQ